MSPIFKNLAVDPHFNYSGRPRKCLGSYTIHVLSFQASWLPLFLWLSFHFISLTVGPQTFQAKSIGSFAQMSFLPLIILHRYLFGRFFLFLQICMYISSSQGGLSWSPYLMLESVFPLPGYTNPSYLIPLLFFLLVIFITF